MSEPSGSKSWQELIARYGAWTLLAFYLLGAIPGLRSPIDRLEQAIKAEVAVHNAETARYLRAICYRLPAYTGAPPCDP